GDAEELGPRVVLASEPVEPASASPQNSRGHRNGLHIGHSGRAAKQPDVGGERRLQAGLPRLPLDALDQPGLLAADVGSGTSMHIHIKVEAGPTGVLAQETLLV